MLNSFCWSFRFIILLITNLYVINSFAQTNSCKLEVHQLTGNFYVYTTWQILSGEPYPSNSMYLVTKKGVVLFDTPWDSTCFQPLLDSIRIRHHKKPVMCISTHFHADRTAGLDFFNAHGIKTYTSYLTDSLSIVRNEPRAKCHFTNDTSFCIGGYCFSSYYPGEGHTKDNIVIWFEKEKILYGGCFVKSTENNDIGNIADANLEAWSKSVEKLINKFQQPAYIIPGHLSWASNKSLKHTLYLLKNKQ